MRLNNHVSPNTFVEQTVSKLRFSLTNAQPNVAWPCCRVHFEALIESKRNELLCIGLIESDVYTSSGSKIGLWDITDCYIGNIATAWNKIEILLYLKDACLDIVSSS